ncbi:Ig-like domain-containing protein [Rhodococcus sp. OK519]|uniref:Ig-like domain-containing protein n=1 Tax=Rhodococcus sp. OK519 TaxID=2135729 RepID=UPI000D36DD59|nr:Ig-like domain-containing protein [Rhodococcus sp. OK519]
MSDRNIRRFVGGLSAFAVAAGFAVTAGVGVAGAAPGSVTWNDGSSKYTRTVSNTTPSEGDIVTVSTKFERTGGVVEWIQAVKDLHPSCLTYVSGNTGGPEVASDYVRVTGNWPVYPNISPKSQTFEFNYRVGADCARGVPLSTTMHYGGSLGSGTYSNKGPSITVSKNTTSTNLAQIASAQVGQATNLVATVTGGAQGDAVEFFDGNTKVGTGNLDANGTATYAWTPSTRGSHTVMAKFPGTVRANASQSGQQTIDVAQVDAGSNTAIGAVTGAQVGRASTLEATVSPAGAGGTVLFKDGAEVLAQVAVNGAGKAAYQWTPTTAGSHTIAAVFSGRDGVVGSTGTATVNVAAKPIDNSESATAIANIVGAKVGVAQNISAQVTPGNAGGTVTFKDGDTVIGTANLDGNGVASLSWTPAVEGQRVIRAEYSGAGTVNASNDDLSVSVAPATNGGDGGEGGSAGSLGGGFGSLGG